MPDAADDNPPEGFLPLERGGEFVRINGPVFMKRDGSVRIFGFRVMARHCNPIAICHGGWLATMADMFLPLGASKLAKTGDAFLLTVSLTMDFLGPARLGDWVEGQVELLTKTKRLVFAQGILAVNAQPVLRANGIFRIAAPITDLLDAASGERRS